MHEHEGEFAESQPDARRAVMERSNPGTSDTDSISRIHFATDHFGQQHGKSTLYVHRK